MQQSSVLTNNLMVAQLIYKFSQFMDTKVYHVVNVSPIQVPVINQIKPEQNHTHANFLRTFSFIFRYKRI
jgi:hypothetical protein